MRMKLGWIADRRTSAHVRFHWQQTQQHDTRGKFAALSFTPQTHLSKDHMAAVQPGSGHCADEEPAERRTNDHIPNPCSCMYHAQHNYVL